MKNMRKGLALLLSFVILVGMMPMYVNATETVPETTGETVPETTGETAPEAVKVSCTGQHWDNGELIAGNDYFTAEGNNLTGISAIWTDGYDDLLTELYGSDYFSPYAISVEGYVPGEPITIFVEIEEVFLLPNNVAVYYIDADGNHQRIENITVSEIQHEELLFTGVEFTVNNLGVFAIGNELIIQSWSDDQIELYAAAIGMTGVSAVDAKANVDTGKTFTDYICYTVTPEGIGAEDYASYAVVMPENFDMDNLALYAVTAEGLFPIYFTVENGVVSFEYFGEFTFACGVAAVPGGYPLVGLELTGTPPADCFVGESISLPDATVTAVYAKDGEEYRKVLHPVNSVEEDGYMVVADTSAVGQTTVHVTYGTATVTFPIQVHQQKFEDNETGVRVDVDAFGTTGVSVTVLDNAQFEQSPLLNHVVNFVAYDIDLTGYQQGDTATVTLPIPEGVVRPAVFYVSDDGMKVVRMHATENGDGTISFETNHFSTYALGDEQYTSNPVTSENYPISDSETITLENQTATRPGAEINETIWKLVSSLTAGKNYLIVNRNTEGSGVALGKNSSNNIYAPSVNVMEGDAHYGVYIKDPADTIQWTVSGSYIFQNGNRYLRQSNNSLTLNRYQSTTFNTDGNNLYYNGSYSNWNPTYYYVKYTNGSWGLSTGTTNSSLYFYEKTELNINEPDILYSVNGTNKTDAPAVPNFSLELTSKLYETAGGKTTDITESAGITPKYQLVEGKGDPSVFTSFDENGVATLSGVIGTAVVRVTYALSSSEDSEVWDEFVVTTAEPEYKLELSQPKKDENGNTVQDDYEPITAPIVKKNVQEGDTHNIWAVITANGEDLGKLSETQLEKLTFVSSNESIATVDPKTGLVTFHGGEGTVVITAVYEYQDGKSVTDTVVFSVSQSEHMVPSDGTNDFPEYPNEGSIRFDKHATAVGNFSDTGMVQVELSMTGVPFTSGSEIDVVIMLDMSSSMNEGGNKPNRQKPAIEAAQQALEMLVKNEDGTYNKNRVAIYGFNGWHNSSNTTNNANDYNDNHKEDVYHEYKNGSTAGTSNFNVSCVAPMQTYDDSNYQQTYNDISDQYILEAGTNYAAALKQCYLTLQNTKQEGRKQFVIFMTDGAASTGFAYFNGNNKAVYDTGDLGTDGFDMIDTVASKTEWYSTLMKDAGVEIYTVGVQIQGGNDTETNNAKKVLQKIAGTQAGNATVAGFEQYALTVEGSASGLKDAFSQIAHEIKQAATDVKVTDKIADDYTMVFDVPNQHINDNDGDQEYYIEVREYQLNAVPGADGTITDYTRGEYASKMKLYMGIEEDGEHYYAATAAGSINGQNKFAAPAFDTKPLGSMGTKYYWTTDGTKGDSGISVKDANGTTYYFVSAGNGTHNMISGAYAYGEFHEHHVTDGSGNKTGETSTTSRDLIIATPYFVYNAETRMLVWTADKLSSTELALNYFLFLDKSGGHVGSHDEKPAGTYETNDYATLQYTNFQNNLCEQEFPIPQMTWNGAQVSYVFYLVNKNGQPVNRAGRVVPFSEAVYVTDVFTYSITWNELETSDSLVANRLAAELVPDVYQLYDQGAAYKIHVFEDQNQANLNNHFLITKGADAAVNTTYVYNTKSDAVKYTTPGIHAENKKFLCKGEGTLTPTVDANGVLIGATYIPAAGETQKKFTSGAPHGNEFYDQIHQYAYFKGKDDNGNDCYYTIVEKDCNTTVEKGFDFSNTTVAFAVMWLPRLETDTVVIDFGLDVVVDVTYNDALNSQVLGVMNDKPRDSSGEIMINEGTYGQRRSSNDPINLGVTIDGNQVNVGIAYADSQNSVRVSLDKNQGMLVKDPLVFYYESQVSYYSGTNSETLNTELMYSSVTVIPATTIYYEDEYVTLSSESKTGGSWVKDDKSSWTPSQAATGTQSSDRPGANKVSELYDADNLYGYDPAYSECSNFSMGNAAMFTADLTNRGVATFEFYGTGFDVIATTSNQTGTIIVKVYPWENGQYSTTALESFIVDTYYGYTYGDTDPDTGEAIWIVTTNDPNALYQVPVMKVADLEYGRYKAEIQIRYSPAFDHTSSGGSYDFYMDAIRIYDPAGDNPTNPTVKNAYKADGESLPDYAELRNWVIDAKTFDTFTGDTVPGAVFIDGKGKNATVEDYKNYGPNNELYLAKGQAVSFHLDGLKAHSIQLALKSVGGTSKPQIWYFENNVAKEFKFKDSNEIDTATDMYYDITALKGKDVLIQNEGDAILSITNVKMTFATPEDEPATPEEAAQVMSVNRSGIEAVLMFLRTPSQDIPQIPETPENSVPETTVPETTVPETTVPETTVPETTVPETTVPETTVPETTVPETTVPKNPTSKPSGNQSTETELAETAPAEPDSTATETTEPETQISDDQEVAATEEPEQEQNNPPAEEQQDPSAEQDAPAGRKTLWQIITGWFARLIDSIIGMFDIKD